LGAGLDEVAGAGCAAALELEILAAAARKAIWSALFRAAAADRDDSAGSVDGATGLLAGGAAAVSTGELLPKLADATAVRPRITTAPTTTTTNHGGTRRST